MDSQQLRDTIARLQAGDQQACRALFAEYGPRLYGYFFRATGHHHDAEDLLSECMLRVVRTLKTYRHEDRFEPWLFRIAANLVRDRIRRIKIRPSNISLSAQDEHSRPLSEELEDVRPSVDAGLLAAETSVELQSALSELDETTRQMILLRHFGEMSFREIATAMDCPLGTALAKVHRGLKVLRTKLKPPG